MQAGVSLETVGPGRILVAAALMVVGCKPTIHPEDTELKIVHDIDGVCARIGAGDYGSWHDETFTSKTWQQLQKRQAAGDTKAGCDAAKVTKKLHEKTRTCTVRVVRGFKKTACR